MDVLEIVVLKNSLKNTISVQTRMNIFDGLRIDNVKWSEKLYMANSWKSLL